MKKILSILLLAAILLPAHAGHRTEQNLSNSIVNAIVEDDLGYVWVGTFRGLNRLNGRDYFQYFSQYDSLTIQNNQVKALLNDSNGRLWVATVSGLSIYDAAEDTFHHVAIESPNTNLLSLFESSTGDILACDGMQILKYDQAEDIFRVAVKGDVFGWNYITVIMSPVGDLWACTYSTLKCYNPHTMSLKYERDLSEVEYTSFTLLGDDICISNDRIQLFSTVNRTFSKLPDISSSGMDFSRLHVTLTLPYGKNGYLLYSQQDGLFLYSDGKIISQNDKNFPFEAPSFVIRTMFMDSKGNLWFGSSDQGLKVIYSYSRFFNNSPLAFSGIQGHPVNDIKEDEDGNLLIGTHDRGLFVFDWARQELVSLDLGLASKDNFMHKPDISSVVTGHDGEVWVASASHSKIFKCSYKDNSFRILHNWNIPFIMSMALDRDGDLWASSADGLVYRIGHSDGQVQSIKVHDTFSFVPALLPLQDGTVMVAAFNYPIYVITPQGGTSKDWKVEDFKPFKDNYKDCIRQMAFVPTCLFMDSEGDIWMGTVANGVIRYDSRSGKMSQVFTEPCTDIESIEEDLEGNIWFSTQHGIGKWNRSDGTVLSFFKEYGLGGDQFCDRSSCLGRGGILYFGGTHGLTFFNPKEIREQDVDKLLLESIDLTGGDSIPLREKSSVNLSYRQGSFNISFAAIDFSEAQRVRYQYRLEPFNKDWITSEDKNIAYFSNVPTGKYTFSARAMSLDGTKILAEKTLDITIAPAPWLSWWAILLYILIGSFVAAVIIYQSLRLSKEKSRNEEVEKEREFFTNVSHEFRTPLTMIAGPVKLLSDESVSHQESVRLLSIVQHNVDRMLRLVNQMLDFGKMEKVSLKLKVAQVDIIPFLSNLAETFSETAAAKNITFTVTGLEGSMKVWIDEDKVDKVCYNLLSNAFKYSPEGSSVRFIFDSDVDGKVAIKVADTGPGIPVQYREKIFERYFQIDRAGHKSYGTGLGLAYARSLAEIHHGKLEFTGGDVGSEFTFTLPVNEAAYADAEKVTVSDTREPFVKGEFKRIDTLSEDMTDKKETIMVVDDDVDVSHYVREILAMSYNVICRFDAQSALASMHETPFDLVLCDVMMPGRSGFDLCRDIKSDIQLSHIPVVLVTAKTSVQDQVEGLQCGADAYITKPFDPNYLLALIQSRLRNTEHLRSIIAGATDTDKMQGEEGFSDRDKAFLDELYSIMEEGLSNAEIDITTIIDRMKISRSKLYYKIKGLTGENPGELFRHYKLNRAAQLLREQKYNMSEIADMTGFNTLSHFSTTFKKHFGVPPSEYAKGKPTTNNKS